MPSAAERHPGLERDLLAAGLVDTHYHIGPEAIPRRYDVSALAEVAGRATVVLKNHSYATTPLAALARAHHDVNFLGGIVLNRYVGGLNPDAIAAAAAANCASTSGSEGAPPMVVWLPTVHARAHLETFGYEYDPRWAGGRAESGEPRPGTQDTAVEVFDANGRPGARLPETLAAVAEAGARLATGHLSAREILRVVPLALDAGVPGVLITHPHYPSVALADEDLVALSRDPRVFIEHCFAIHTIEGVPLEAFARSIQATGPDQVVVASDFGQVVSGTFPEATLEYARLLADLLGDALSRDALVALFSGNGLRALGLTG